MTAYAVVVSLKSYISGFLYCCDAILHPSILEILVLLLKKLISFQNFVERLDSRSRTRMHASFERVAEKVCKFRDDLSGNKSDHFFEEAREFDQFFEDEIEFDQLFAEVHSLIETLEKMEEEYHSLLEDDEEVVSSSSSSSRAFSTSKIIGLCNERRQLKEDIVNCFSKQTVYTLFGMIGVGKTTLAREIFEDLEISEWFVCRAWVKVGDPWNSEEIIEAILAQVDPDVHMMVTGGARRSDGETVHRLAQSNADLFENLKVSFPKFGPFRRDILHASFQHENVTRKTYSTGGYQAEICTRLKESLKGKRYLIVLDDVWDSEVYQYLKKSLPDGENGSRVLITTTRKYVGNDIISSTTSYSSASSFIYSRPIGVRLLNQDESWHLLRYKVFFGDSCPPLLEEAGKKIAEKCDGLPLTIVTVADLLSKIPESLWIDVATQKKHQLFIDAYDQISKVLHPSYTRLNESMKLCLLYLGVFPLKYEIPGSKLTNLWVVEEILDPSMCLTLEKRESLAGDVLQTLSVNSLVMVYKNSNSLYKLWFSDEKIKTCGLHSSWWHFCQREARRTYFFYVLDSYQDGLEACIRSQIRLSIHNNVLFALKDVYNSMEENCASTAQSLLCFGPYHPYQVPVCFGLKLLLRLDALNIRFYDFPLEVLDLLELQYLALTCNGNLPPSISKLQKLRYLIFHPHLSIKSSGAPSHLPIEIWDMKELELLDVMGHDLPDLGCTSLRKLAKLSNATTGSCSVLKRVPDLKKLGIRIEMNGDATEELRCFDHVSHLIKLQSLKCIIVNPYFKLEVVSPIAPFQCFPFFLNKLSFNGLGYPWQEMSKIALLPYLKVLKLQCDAFRGPVWEVVENGFQKLYSLQIESMDLAKLKGESGSFKCLQLLNIKHCYKLEELHLGHFQNVQKVEVVDSNPLVEMNLKRTMRQRRHNPLHFMVHYSWKS